MKSSNVSTVCAKLFRRKLHDDVIKWKHFPRYWPFVRVIHRSPVQSPHKGQWRGAFDVFFDLRLNKRLSKQSWGWWFETPWRPLWRHCNDPLFSNTPISFGATPKQRKLLSSNLLRLVFTWKIAEEVYLWNLWSYPQEGLQFLSPVLF